jgi:hypothetical protein
MNGKGSKRRPTDEKRFGENWDKVFNPKLDKQFLPKWTEENLTVDQDPTREDLKKPMK